MNRSSKPRGGFTLVELLVVIGIIAVLIGILLPVISRARKQAATVACMANLRSVGQLLYTYAGDNKGSLPYAYYRSDAVPSFQSAVDESDPNTSLYVWWSVLRSYMRKNTAMDNGADNSGNTLSSRGMKGLWCPASLATERGVSYAPNMVALPDRQFEVHPLAPPSLSNPTIVPVKFSQLYPDNALFWDENEILTSLGSQYVAGYGLDNGSFENPRKAYWRYRNMAADPAIIPPGSALANEVPVAAGTNKDITGTASGGKAGEIRWRHGNNDSANFLFTDGTVRTFKITVGTPGTANCRGDALHKYFRIRSPNGFRIQG